MTSRRVVASRFSSLAALAYLVVIACTTEPIGPTTQGMYLASINIPDYAGWVGETVPIAAAAETGFFVFQGPAIDLQVKWTSSNPAVFTVVSDGKETTQSAKLKMVGPGTATLRVDVNDPRIDPNSVTLGATSKVSVSEAGVMRVTPKQATMTIGDTKDFTIGFVGASGQAVLNPHYIFDFRPFGTGLSLVGAVRTTALTDPPVVSVKATAAGTSRVVIVAYLQSDKLMLGQSYFEDTAFITVNAPVTPAKVTVSPTSASLFVGGTKQISAQVFDASNNAITFPVTWSSSDTTFAKVSSAGIVTAAGTGTQTSAVAQITARAATGVEASTAVTVYKLVSQVVIDPNPKTLQVGSDHIFTAALKDNAGNTIPSAATTITWSILNQTFASVDNFGKVVALAVGTTKLKATTAEGVSGTADITIEGVPFNPNVVRVQVIPDSVAVNLSQGSSQFTAKAFDANGNEVPVSGFRWLIDDSNLASLDDTGLVTFKGRIGSTFIRAFYGNAANSPGGAGKLTVK